MVERTTQLEALTSVAVINSILTAVPSPAFALGSNKKILAFNSAFQALVRRQFPVLADAEQRGDLKLALDINVADLMTRLDQNGNTAVLTGFAIGIGDTTLPRPAQRRQGAVERCRYRSRVRGDLRYRRRVERLSNVGLRADETPHRLGAAGIIARSRRR